MGIQLSDEQRCALDGIVDDIRAGRREVTLGGLAGTGKTTLIRFLLDILPGRWVVVAYTGKAASVLRRKGVEAKTIHSLIYHAVEVVVRLPNGKLDRRITWQLREFLDDVDGIIIDESSMVTEKIHADLLSFGVPLIEVGDHGQLEPVGDRYNLMANPRYRLEQVHRNAGPIVQFAHALRNEDEDRVKAMLRDGVIRYVPRWRLSRLDETLARIEQVCVGYNQTRVALNARVRTVLGRTSPLPQDGDRVMCLRNDHGRGLYNGQQGVVHRVRIGAGQNLFDFHVPGEDIAISDVRFDPEQFNNPKPPSFLGGLADSDAAPTPEAPMASAYASGWPFDYCYASTCHKLQGDEADSVAVVVQVAQNWSKARWTYTAATRARRRLIWIV